MRCDGGVGFDADYSGTWHWSDQSEILETLQFPLPDGSCSFQAGHRR
jgi:hypothetical protein